MNWHYDNRRCAPTQAEGCSEAWNQTLDFEFEAPSRFGPSRLRVHGRGSRGAPGVDHDAAILRVSTFPDAGLLTERNSETYETEDIVAQIRH